MEKRAILVFSFILLLIIPLSFSLSTDMKDSYMKKETIITKLSGNFLEPLTAQMIQFKRNNVLLALDFDLVLVNEDYYLWAVSPEDEGNYSLLIKNVATIVNGMQTRIDFQQNFTVSKNSSLYSISPGAVSAMDNFTINLRYYGDEKTVITTDFPEKTYLLINPGKNEIKYSPDLLYGSNLIEINLGGYTIPAYLTGKARTPYEYQTSFLSFEPKSIFESLKLRSAFETSVYLTNKANRAISDISLYYNSSILEVTPDSFSLDSNKSVSINIKLLNPLTNSLDTKITASAVGENSSILPISFSVISNVSRRNISISNITSNNLSTNDLYCEELSGTMCPVNSDCSGELKDSIEGKCCLGSCISNTPGGSNWAIYILIILIIAVVGYIFFRYKKSPKQTNNMKDKLSELDLKHSSLDKNEH